METVIANTLQNTDLLNSNYDEDGTYYPESDGQHMANSSVHFERIATTKYGLESLFADRDDVFVAGDLFWYPVKGETRLAVAPDVMVVFGRPNNERKSYKQWNEENIPPQVVFEFLSESNTAADVINKAIFFERHGVQEYYIYDLRTKELSGFIRYTEKDKQLEELADMNDWKSPRLGIRFDMSSGELVLRKPDGEPFLSYAEVEQELQERTRQLEQTEVKLEQTEVKLEQTEVKLEQTQIQLSASESRAAALAEKLRELGINPDAL
ncbi:MAG: Uma2 family endonuclease [Candidatus Kapaibacterium sp.]|nr:MAG: Uma2 family endonuclease [Candidatus Kapabacteria bacterium]